MFGLTPYNKRGGIQRRSNDVFDVDKFFESFFNDSLFPAFYNNSGQMRVDIKENEKDYIVEAELPGVKKEEINIDLHDDRLTIAVERNEQVNEKNDNYIRRERRYGSMSRTFSVANVNQDQVTADFKNGILSIILPKKDPGVGRGRRIQIQ